MDKYDDMDMSEDELEHHGILGQKWGVRRYQNEDGSLTPEGKLRYRKQEEADRWRQERKDFKATRSIGRHAVNVLFNGPIAAYTYNSARTAGYNRLESEGITLASNLLGGPLGNMIASKLISSDYKEKKYRNSED